MAAYAAVRSLKQTVQRLLEDPKYPTNLLPTREIQSLHNEFWRLQGFIGQNDNWDEQIREAAYKLEDLLESKVSDLLLLVSDQTSDADALKTFSQDFKKAMQKEINSFSATARKIELEHYATRGQVQESNNSLTEDFQNSEEEEETEMVGMEDELQRLLDRCVSGPSRLCVIPIYGMVGIGKTTLVKKIYHHPLVLDHFQTRVFVTIGQKQLSRREILQRLLVSIDPAHFDSISRDDDDNDDAAAAADDDDDMALQLYEGLKGQTYMIVLDDVWDTQICRLLYRILPDDDKRSRILFTTRIRDVAEDKEFGIGGDKGDCVRFLNDEEFGIGGEEVHGVRFLNVDESWSLLRKIVFVGENSSAPCSYQLERIGRKIAKNCEGLPLAIIAVGNQLSKAEKTPSVQYWKKVAENKNSLITSVEDEPSITRRLLMSLNPLPQYLKACFLYIGVFSKMDDISTSKFFKLWIAEEFIETKPFSKKKVRDIAESYLEELVSQSLVLVRNRSSMGRIKTCSIHYVFRRLCVSQAEKLKFFHRMYNYSASSFVEGIYNHRRLCILNNVLFGINDVSDVEESASKTRSLLCTGPNHQYPVSVFLGLSLLRVLDALTIRFYEFPHQLRKLFQLRYLALTYNGGEIPPSISRLWNIQYLHIFQCLSVISSRNPSYLPVEIWDMRELRHLQVMGSDLPNPSNVNSNLPNILTLKDVSAHSCTEEVLQRMPNLEKLGIQIVLAPDDADTLRPFDNLFLLSKLESFKCVVSNPSIDTLQVLALPESISNFPSTLRKLTLSGCGFDWKDMELIGALPRLEVLKLQFYAFRGPEWEIYEEDFQQLKYLLIEDHDLVNWIVEPESFPSLETLIVRHCYILEEIPLEIGCTPYLEMVEVVDCSRSAMESAKRIQLEQVELGREERVQVHVRYDSMKGSTPPL